MPCIFCLILDYFFLHAKLNLSGSSYFNFQHMYRIFHTIKRFTIFPSPLFPAKESLVSDIPAGDGKIANLFSVNPSTTSHEENLATSCSFYSSVSVHCKRERRKPYPLPYGLRNPYRNLQSENSQDYAPETSTKLYVHEFGFLIVCLYRDLKGAGVHASG
jgi:hypothetical protein